MAGFLENLLREGTDAGLGIAQGRRAGEAEQQQAMIEAQKRQLQTALIQAQIARTGRQDVPNPLDDDLLRARIGQAERANQPLEPGSLEARRQEALIGQAERSNQPQPTTRSRGAVTAGAQGIARNFADNAVAGGADPTVTKPVLLQSIQAEFPELEIGEAVGIVDRAFAAASNTDRPETGSILGLGEALPAEGGEPWQNDPRAVAKIEEIEAMMAEGSMAREDGISEIAQVKEIAAGG